MKKKKNFNSDGIGYECIGQNYKIIYLCIFFSQIFEFQNYSNVEVSVFDITEKNRYLKLIIISDS